PRDPHVVAAVGPGGQGAMCALHPQNGSVATCQRCGNYVCCVCWTRWQNLPMCLTCVNRGLEKHESTPFAARAHFRQAILAVLFGISAWLLTLFGTVVVLIAAAKDLEVLAMFGVLALLPAPLPAVLGVGQGAAAIRSRGN